MKKIVPTRGTKIKENKVKELLVIYILEKNV